MEEKNNNQSLFSAQYDEFVSLDDEEIVLDDDYGYEHPREPRFGGKNIAFFVLILLLACATVFFMSFDRQGITFDDASSVGSLDASQTFLENESSADTSSEESADESVTISLDVSEESSSEEESTVPEEPFHGWVINDMGYTYLYYGVGVEQFNYSDATLGKYTNSIDALRKKIPDGINVYCMPIPTRVGFLYNEISNEIKREDNFYNSLQETFLDTLEESLGTELTFVNLYDAMEAEYQNGAELYFKTDLNWTSDAAYLAYRSFCAAANQSASAKEAYEKHAIEGFLGTFYTATQSDALKENADTFYYYKNSLTDACKVTLYSGKSVYKDYSLMNNSVYGNASAYNIYLGTAGQHFKIETTYTAGKKLLVIGDGSAAAMMPFLITNYSEIHYIDAALYRGDLTELFDATEFDDVLVATYATNAVKGNYPNHLAAMAGVTQDE